MRRPRQHVNEDISRAALESLLSGVGWAVNWNSKDYGIDCSVEIFENGISTGLEFKIQLKSTEKKRTKKGLSLTVGKDHVAYWTAHQLLVLIVLYESKTQLLYGHWCPTPNITHAAGPVYFRHKDQLDPEHLSQICHDVEAEHRLPNLLTGRNLKYGFEVSGDEESNEVQVFESTIRGYLNSYFPELSPSIRGEPRTVVFKYVCDLGVSVFLGVRNGFFQFKSKPEIQLDPAYQAQICLSCLGGLLMLRGFWTDGRRLLLVSLPDSSKIGSLEIHIKLAKLAFDLGDLSTSILILKHVGAPNMNDEAIMICFDILASQASSTSVELISDLSNYVCETLDCSKEKYSQEAVASLFFILGKYLKFSDASQAQAHVEKALELHPSYQTDPEVLTELATIYERTNLFHEASAVLEKVMSITPSPRIQALLGTYYLKQGRLLESHQCLAPLLFNDSIGPFFRLQSFFVSRLREILNVSTFNRDAERLAAILGELESLPPSASMDRFPEVLEADPLFFGGWFFAGLSRSVLGQNPDACNSYLMSYCCNPLVVAPLVCILGSIPPDFTNEWLDLAVEAAYLLVGERLPGLVDEYMSANSNIDQGQFSREKVVTQLFSMLQPLRARNENKS